MRRQRDSQVKTDTFPFMNVMVGMIVVLLLFIFLTISTRVIGLELQQDQGFDRGPNLSGDATEEEYRKLEKQLRDLERQLTDRSRRLSELARLQAQLEELLAAKGDALLPAVGDKDGIEGVVLGRRENVEMVEARGFAVKKKPRFVEVKADGFIAHFDNGARSFPLREIKQKDSKLAKLLKRADRNRKDEYLLFLVHPNGAIAYKEIRKYLLDNHSETKRITPTTLIKKSRIDLGVEPFSETWLLIIGPQGTEN